MLLDRIIALRNDRTVYRDGGNCLKVFEKNVSKAKVFTEAFNQTQAQCAGINVPSISQITQIDGKWAIIYDFIEGKSLNDEMVKNGSDTAACLERLAELQLEIHKPAETDLPQLKDRLGKDILKAKLSRETTDKVMKILEKLPNGDGIFHGCFSPDNIILGDDGKSYIIDWTHAAQGSVFADAAGTFLTFIIDGKNEEAEAYLDIFGKKNESDTERVKEWIPVIAASRLSYSNERESKLLSPWLEAI